MAAPPHLLVVLLLLTTTPTLDAGLAPQDDVLLGSPTPRQADAVKSTPQNGVVADVAEVVVPSTSPSAPAPEAQALGAAPLPAVGRQSGQDDEEYDDEDDDEEYEDAEDDEYDEEDEDEFEDPDDFEYEDGESGDVDRVRDDDEYEDDYDGDGEDEREGAGDGEVRVRERVQEGVHIGAEQSGVADVVDVEDADDVVVAEDAVDEANQEAVDEANQEAVVRERRAEVRSLSDLPLSKLLRVQTELRRLTGRSPSKSNDQCDSKKKRKKEEEPEQGASRRWLAGSVTAVKDSVGEASPNAQPLNWSSASRKGASSSTAAPVRRRGGSSGGSSSGGGDRGGGWEEDWEEVEEEDEGGWISWNKGGKKKGKGDIGSIFQLSVTFLAFLAFGGYLLCLIMQAIKGGGYGYYPYGGFNGAYTAQSSLRPAMMLVMPTRAVTRRPTRPAATGRKKREAIPEDDVADRHGGKGSTSASWRSWVPSFGEEDIRLLPQMDVDRMHRALLVLAEGYASFYHKRYSARQ